jgi:hypothetical protein
MLVDIPTTARMMMMVTTVMIMAIAGTTMTILIM